MINTDHSVDQIKQGIAALTYSLFLSRLRSKKEENTLKCEFCGFKSRSRAGHNVHLSTCKASESWVSRVCIRVSTLVGTLTLFRTWVEIKRSCTHELLFEIAAGEPRADLIKILPWIFTLRWIQLIKSVKWPTLSSQISKCQHRANFLLRIGSSSHQDC